MNLRFQAIPAEVIEQINALTGLEQLKTLRRDAVTVNTLAEEDEEFEQAVEALLP